MIIAWWAQVTDTLEERSVTVFRRGTLIDSKDSILIGGQYILDSDSVHKELLKKAQKNLKKNITSEKIKNSIPDFNLSSTSIVWYLVKVASKITSFHQKAKHKRAETKPQKICLFM